MAYNGWSNYETWCVALWIGNEQGSYRHWMERGEEAWRSAEATKYRDRDTTAACSLAEELKQYHADASPLAESGDVYSSLLNAALSAVDWYEIAVHYLPTDRHEEEAEEQEETA